MTIVSSLLVTRGSKMRSCIAGGNADTVVEDGERAQVALSAVGEEDAAGMRVARVAQQLDDDVLDAADVVLGLPALGLGDLEPNVAVAEVLLDLEEGVARDRRDEVEEIVWGSHASQSTVPSATGTGVLRDATETGRP